MLLKKGCCQHGWYGRAMLTVGDQEPGRSGGNLGLMLQSCCCSIRAGRRNHGGEKIQHWPPGNGVTAHKA